MNQTIHYEIQQVMPLARAAGLQVSLASFYQPVTTQSTTGNFTGGFTPVVGLQNIECQKMPSSLRQVAANTTRTIEYIEGEQFEHILLYGIYSQIPAAAGKGWQVVVDSVTYELKGGDVDSQGIMTRCRVRLVVI